MKDEIKAETVHWRKLSVRAFERYAESGGPLVSAATAFFAILSAAPLIIFAVVISGVVFDEGAARRLLERRLRSVLSGPKSRRLISDWLESLSLDREGLWTTLAGLAVTLFAASKLFASIQQGLNQVWGVKPRMDKKVAKAIVRKRMLSFLMVFGCGVLLLAVLGAQAALSAARSWLQVLPDSGWLVDAGETLGTVVVMVLIFATLFKVLPDAEVAWPEAGFGALVTSILVAAGAFVAGLYLQHIASNSVQGAAGTLAVIFLWIYYCSQVFFLGATLTRVWIEERGFKRRPEGHARVR